MLRRESRFVAPLLLANLLLVSAVSMVRAAEDDPTGTSTASVTLLIIGGIGIVLVIAWIAINNLRTPPKG